MSNDHTHAVCLVHKLYELLIVSKRIILGIPAVGLMMFHIDNAHGNPTCHYSLLYLLSYILFRIIE